MEKTNFKITCTNIHTGRVYLVAKVVAKGDAFNILKMMESMKPDYLTYQLS